jgi:hypothetical protein
VTADEVEYTAEFTTEAMIGEGAATFDGTQYIIFDVNEAINCEAKSYSWAVWAKTEAEGGSIVAWAPYSGTPAAGNGEMDENDPHMAAVHSLFWGFTAPVPVFDIGWVDLMEATTAINDGEWHHIVLTNDVESSAQKLYVDGVLEAEGEMDVTGYPAEELPVGIEEFLLKVGYATSGWPANEAEDSQWSYFTGTLDHFIMFGEVIPQEAVTELFEATSVASYEVSDFSVYPNPARDYIMIKGDYLGSGLAIFNSVGQEVHRTQVLNQGAMINISDLGSGVYFVKSGEAVQKLIVK